ncbi:hypothetical protein [Thalassotalea sp. PLHSN55]|uniref:hypothetical protein n=1 Tax=Thalassotalea sp. PLHSN55 TaxID=3435888 RepID=UPI003F85C1B9
MKGLLTRVGVILASAISCFSFADQAQQAKMANTASTVTFAVIGDMPYSKDEEKLLTAPNGKIYQQLNYLQPSVLIHLGDIKSGGKSCTDKRLFERLALLLSLYPNQLVYTPGDNEWTDCDRGYLSTRFDELERLAFLRQHFFAQQGLEMVSDLSGLTRQKGMPENVRWQIDNLVFTTLHVAGTSNGRKKIEKSNVEQALNAADKRDLANEQWLAKAFAQANNAQGLVIAFQADIYKNQPSSLLPACSARKRKNCDPYKSIRSQIARLAKTYDKPVLVAHGDTHEICFGLLEKDVRNLWRLNALGDKSTPDAANIRFDASNKDMPFQVTTLLTNKTLPKTCY